MARQLKEIYDSIIFEKQHQTELLNLQPNVDTAQNLLDDLTTTSKVAEWRLIYWVVAVAIWIHEKMWDLFKKEIEDIVDHAIPGTAEWYRNEALKFQYSNDPTKVQFMEWKGNYGHYDYEKIDKGLRTIKYASVVEDTNKVVVVKVAHQKEDKPEYIPVETEEFKSFVHYMKYFKRFAGVDMTIISAQPDQLALRYTINYNIDMPAKAIEENVYKTINEFLKNLPFDGTFNLTKLTDAIQQVRGVEEPILDYAYAWHGVNFEDNDEKKGITKIARKYPQIVNLTSKNSGFKFYSYRTFAGTLMLHPELSSQGITIKLQQTY